MLAGGRSRRLGQDKALLRIGSDRPLVETLVDRLSALAAEVIVVADDAERLGRLDARIVPDALPGSGMLGGVYSGLRAASREHALVVGCDMPFLSPRLLGFLLSLPRDYDVLLPRWESGYVEPLHAVYSGDCLEVIERRLSEGRYAAGGFLSEVCVRYVDEPILRSLDPDLLSFFNVNSPADLDRAREIARRLSGPNVDR